MKPVLTAIAALALAGSAARAHPGHLAEAAGHGHWLGAAAIGAAIAIGLWAAVNGRRDAAASSETGAEAGDEEAEETQEA